VREREVGWGVEWGERGREAREGREGRRRGKEGRRLGVITQTMYDGN
jgi:hypothetical protein